MKKVLLFIALLVLSACSASKANLNKSDNLCQNLGPQTPRDISSKAGTNAVTFTKAPSPAEMNLCNIHFHKNAEHKGPQFSIHKGDAKDGGYACLGSNSLSQKQLRPVTGGACEGIEAGDTVEVHWVHSSCDIKPGPTLGSCLSDDCAEPVLRVETQVFLLVNDSTAQPFDAYTYLGNASGFHQARSLPRRKGAVEFLGSTTGPKYNNETCSPLKVNWSVSPKCNLLDINTLHAWCKGNIFEENKAHGVRKLVTDERFLSAIE